MGLLTYTEVFKSSCWTSVTWEHIQPTCSRSKQGQGWHHSPSFMMASYALYGSPPLQPSSSLSQSTSSVNTQTNRYNQTGSPLALSAHKPADINKQSISSVNTQTSREISEGHWQMFMLWDHAVRSMKVTDKGLCCEVILYDQWRSLTKVYAVRSCCMINEGHWQRFMLWGHAVRSMKVTDKGLCCEVML